MSQIRVPFVNLGLEYELVRQPILEAFDRISSQGSYIMAPDLSQFEAEFADYCGSKYALGVASGGDALFLALKAMGIGSGDEVLVPGNSFIASAWAVVHTGATPVFVDVCEDYNIDPEACEKKINSKTKAIMPVHLTGRTANMGAIRNLGEKYQLKIVEDSAQAVGAKYYDKRAGNLGDVGCFSLHPLKNLHVHGDGGMLTTNSEEIYEKVKLLRNHGLINRDECVVWGYNSRLDSINAAIGSIKLKHLDKWNDRMREIAARYINELGNVVGVPRPREYEECIFHRFIITTDKRDELQKFLEEQGVDSKVNYPIPLHLQKCSDYLGYKEGDLPVVERLAKTILSLPCYHALTDDLQSIVIESVLKFFNK